MVKPETQQAFSRPFDISSVSGLDKNPSPDDSTPRGSAAKKKIATQWRKEREVTMGWLIPGAMVAMVVILAVTLTRL